MCVMAGSIGRHLLGTFTQSKDLRPSVPEYIPLRTHTSKIKINSKNIAMISERGNELLICPLSKY